MNLVICFIFAILFAIACNFGIIMSIKTYLTNNRRVTWEVIAYTIGAGSFFFGYLALISAAVFSNILQ